MVLQYTRYLILGITYLGLVMGNFPGLRMNRPTIALVGSAFFLNDTLALVFTPLTLGLTQALGLNPIPYLTQVASYIKRHGYSGLQPSEVHRKFVQV